MEEVFCLLDSLEPVERSCRMADSRAGVRTSVAMGAWAQAGVLYEYLRCNSRETKRKLGQLSRFGCTGTKQVQPRWEEVPGTRLPGFQAYNNDLPPAASRTGAHLPNRSCRGAPSPEVWAWVAAADLWASGCSINDPFRDVVSRQYLQLEAPVSIMF